MGRDSLQDSNDEFSKTSSKCGSKFCESLRNRIREMKTGPARIRTSSSADVCIALTGLNLQGRSSFFVVYRQSVQMDNTRHVMHTPSIGCTRLDSADNSKNY